jgi:hypothetical protein
MVVEALIHNVVAVLDPAARGAAMECRMTVVA